MKVRTKGGVMQGKASCLEQKNIAHSFGELNETSDQVCYIFWFLERKIIHDPSKWYCFSQYRMGIF